MKIEISLSWPIERIRNTIRTFLIDATKESHKIDQLMQEGRSPLNRRLQKVIRVESRSFGKYVLSYDTERYSKYNKEFMQAIWMKCKHTAEYNADNIPFYIANHNLACYQDKDAFIPVLDCEALQAMLGIKKDIEDVDLRSPYKRTDSLRNSDKAVYRLLLFVHDDITENQVNLILEGQAMPMHEVIVYQSSQFYRELVILEPCDRISAYPEHATWKPIGLMKPESNQKYFHYKSDNGLISSQYYSFKLSKKEELDMGLYKMQWHLDSYPVKDYPLHDLSKVNRLNVIPKPKLNPIKGVFSIPKHFVWNTNCDHWLLKLSPTKYHTVDSKVWVKELGNPQVAWEMGHKLWINKCQNVQMSYPAGKELLDTLYAFLFSVLPVNGFHNKPAKLERYVSDDSWKYIQENRDRLTKSSNWNIRYHDVMKAIENVARGKLPYEAGAVFASALEAISFITSFYEGHLWKGFGGSISLLDYKRFDFFPLLLLETFSFDLLLSDLATPLASLGLHLEKGITVDGQEEVSSLSFAAHDAGHKVSLYIRREGFTSGNYPYTGSRQNILLTNCSRSKLILSLFSMFERLENQGGIFQHFRTFGEDALGLSDGVEALGKEIHLLKVIMFDVFHELYGLLCNAKFYKAFDVQVPTLNATQINLYQEMFEESKLDGVQGAENNVVYKLQNQFVDWNANNVQGFILLPIDGQSPLKFFISTAWVIFCFSEYERDPKVQLGDKASLERFMQYIKPLMQTRMDFYKAFLKKEAWAVEQMKKLPVVTQGCDTAFAELHRTFSPHPDHIYYFSDAFFYHHARKFRAETNAVSSSAYSG